MVSCSSFIASLAILVGHVEGQPADGTAQHPKAEPATTVIHFGVYTSDRATEMYKSFTPLLEALSSYLSGELAVPVDIDLVIARTYEQAQNDLCSGKVQIARFGPASYVVAKQKAPEISIIAVETVKEQKNFNGIIFARADSQIRSLADLRGKTFAFGDKLSTLGRYLPQVELVKAGIRARDLGSFAYLDRHDKVVAAVLNGDFDAGSVKEATFRKYEKQAPGLLPLAKLENVTKPWLAAAGLDARIVAATRKFLIACRDEKLLKPLDDASGFESGADADFNRIREAMRASEEFDR